MNKPIPIVCDDNGKSVNEFTWLDWIAKLDEKLNDAKYSTYAIEDSFYDDNTIDDYEDYHRVAEALQNLITIAVSMQESYLDFNEMARDKICAEVNENNRKRMQ